MIIPNDILANKRNQSLRHWLTSVKNYLSCACPEIKIIDNLSDPFAWANHHHRRVGKSHDDKRDIKALGMELLEFDRKRSLFFAQPQAGLSQLRSTMIQSFNESARQSIIHADAVCQNTFKILSEGPFHFPEDVDWSSDLRGKSWAKGSVRELNTKLFRDLLNSPYRIGDVKIPWEFNKHLFTFDLARAFVLTNDDKYARQFCFLLESWWNQNPVGMNLAWYAPLIVAHRAIAWILSMRFLIHSSAIDERFYLRFQSSLYDHLLWLKTHYEIFPRSTNHLIGNLAGTLVITSAYPDFDISLTAEERAIDILIDQLGKQVYPDGVQYEQSVAYHRYVLEFLYSIILSFQYSGREAPLSVRTTAEKMAEYLMNVISPNGMANLISDADGAYVYKFDNLSINDYRSHLALGAVLFNRGDFLAISNGQAENVYWLNGPGIKFPLPATPSQYQSRSFSAGGMLILRNGWVDTATHVTFDCGNLGLDFRGNGPCMSHGHDDSLSFTLSALGQQILVDRGSGSYTGDIRIHDALRLSMAHNTLSLSPPHESVEKASRLAVESHSIPLGPWTFKNRANTLERRYHLAEELEGCSAAHDGYRRFTNAPIHRRWIFFIKPDVVIIFDSVFPMKQIHSNLYHKILLPFHFSPGTKLGLNGNTVTAQSNQVILHSIISERQIPWQAKVYEGQNTPYKGWSAEDYNYCIPAPTLELETTASLPFFNAFVLHCGTTNDRPFSQANFIQNEKHNEMPLGLSVEGHATSFQFTFLPQGACLLPSNLTSPLAAEIVISKYHCSQLNKAWGLTKETIVPIKI